MATSHDPRWIAETRHHVLKGGKIVAFDGKLVVDVVIKEMSLGDARLSVELMSELPPEFELHIPCDHLKYPCRLEKQRPKELIVRFADQPRAIADPVLRKSGGSGNAAGSSADAAKPVAEALPPLSHIDGSQIKPVYELRFERHPIRSEMGQCQIAVSIANEGAIDAHQPFLCLPCLGLRMEPAPGWAMQEVKSVRKMYRFSRLETVDLAPAQSMHCCTIFLAFDTGGGGSLEFEAGNRHALDEIPDLRLTCIAGAGNYPPGRSPLAVPAAELAARLAALMHPGLNAEPSNHWLRVEGARAAGSIN